MSAPLTFYLAGLSETDNGGIFQYSLTGATAAQIAFTPIANVNYIIFSPNRQVIYATCQSQPIGSIASFQVTPTGLTLLNSVESGANCPCYATVNKESTFLYASNYGENGDASLTEFPLNPDGSLQSPTKVIRHPPGTGPVKDRQDGPHIHCAVLTPDETYLIAVDLGIDALKAYPVSPSTGINESGVVTTKTEAGFGPRHVIFEPDGKIAYVVNELANSISSYAFAEGVFTPIKTVSSIPAYYKGFTKAAAVRFSPDRKAVLVSNRGYDSVAVYTVDHLGGLELKNIVYSIGQAPRDIGFVADSDFFVAANVQTGNAALFRYVPDEFNLVSVEGQTIALPGPLAVLS
jgi:6-phosphogluconolactonase